MWNSPNSPDEKGKKYSIEDLAVLICPLDIFLDGVSESSVREQVEESILQGFDKEELVFAIYQVFDLMLSDDPIPQNGHLGYQNAIVAELLTQASAMVEQVLYFEKHDEGVDLEFYRIACWKSLQNLVIQPYQNKLEAEEGASVSYFEDLFDIAESEVQNHRSKKLTRKLWDELITGELGLFGEFLMDTDWRISQIMDIPQESALELGKKMGISLDVTHALPHTPSEEEFHTANDFLLNLNKELEIIINGKPFSFF